MTAFKHQRTQETGYITEVVYPDHFHRETMPVWLVSALQALGRRAPDLSGRYTWLDLGCGTGVSTLVAAAANPGGRFIGVDFNAAGIAQARALAQASGIYNVDFIESSFDTLLEGGGPLLPPCDFIVSHGVYSWVGPRARQAMHGLVGAALRPGGVFYVSYITHPGAASFGAAQRMLSLLARGAPGTPQDKALLGVAWLKRMAEGGAGYFTEHASAAREVARLGEMDAAYLAHEFLNHDWEAFHVGDVMAAMEAAGCEYAGSASLLENIDALSIPGGMAPVMADAHRAGWTPAQMETARDIARNQNQRRDLYQKSADTGNLLTPDAHRRVLLEQSVMLLPRAPSANEVEAQPGGAELSFDTPIGPVRIPAAAIRPLLHALRQGPRRYAELAALPEYRGNPGVISQLLQVLAWVGWAHFLRPDAGRTAVADEIQVRLDALLEARSRKGPLPRHRLLPAIGSAVPV